MTTTALLMRTSPEKLNSSAAGAAARNKSPRSSILRGLQPNHWAKEVKEVTVITSQDGVFNFRWATGG